MAFTNIVETGNISLIDQVIVESVRDIYLYESDEVCKSFDTYINILESKDYVPQEDFENSIFEVLSNHIESNSLLFEAIWTPEERKYNRDWMNAPITNVTRQRQIKRNTDVGVYDEPSNPKLIEKQIKNNRRKDVGIDMTAKAYHLQKEILDTSKTDQDRFKKNKMANALIKGGRKIGGDGRRLDPLSTEKVQKVRDEINQNAKSKMSHRHNNILQKYKNKSNFSKLLRRGKAMAKTALSRPKLAAKAVGYGIMSKFNKKFQKKANANKYLFKYNTQKRLI